jgi:hypothetical protein
MEGLITPISVATGVVLTGLTAVSLSSSVALGFALGWILQEMTGSLPLLAAAIVVLRPCVYFMFAGYSKGINAAQGPIFWGLFFAWIAHFILRTIRIRRKFHYLVSDARMTELIRPNLTPLAWTTSQLDSRASPCGCCHCAEITTRHCGKCSNGPNQKGI